jgi:hypothetical protein
LLQKSSSSIIWGCTIGQSGRSTQGLSPTPPIIKKYVRENAGITYIIRLASYEIQQVLRYVRCCSYLWEGCQISLKSTLRHQDFLHEDCVMTPLMVAPTLFFLLLSSDECTIRPVDSLHLNYLLYSLFLS